MLKRAFICVIYVVLGWIGCITDAIIPTYTLEKQCGSVIDLNSAPWQFSGKVHYKFTPGEFASESGDRLNCKMTFRSHESKFAVRFTQLRWTDCMAQVILRQERTGEYSRKLQDMPWSLCKYPSSEIVHKVYVTEWNTLVIDLGGQNVKLEYEFTIILNLFTDEPCSGDQHTCDNGRCIDQSLTNTGYNACGDDSDSSNTSDDLSTELIVGIVVGAVLGAAIIVILTLYIIRKVNKPQKPYSNTESLQRMVSSAGIESMPTQESRKAEPPAVGVGVSEKVDISRAGDDPTPLRVGLHDSVEDPREQSDAGYVPPPPSYDVVVGYQDLYNVNNS